MRSQNVLTILFRCMLSVFVMATVMYIPDPTALMEPGFFGLLMADGYLAKISDDPQLWHKWGLIAQKQGELKTEFTEQEIGVSWGDDGPEASDRVAASPIKLVQDLTNGGKYVDVKIDNPLFTAPSDILNKGRYNEQDRIGAEETLTRHNFRVLLDKWHLGIAESEVEEGTNVTAHMNAAKFMQRMVNAYTDNVAQRKDWGVFFSFFAGFDIHHFIAAADRGDLSNGAVPTSDPQMGLMSKPHEHRRTFVWREDGDSNLTLNEVALGEDVDDFEDNIVEEISKIKATSKPTLTMLRRINRICKSSAMIPTTIRNVDGKNKHYYLVMIPGSVRDLLEQDDEFKEVMNSAYQSIVDKHPMLQSGDVLYKNLIIRESEKLDDEEDYFSAKSIFNAISADTADSTKLTFNKATTGGIERFSLTPGTRQFTEYSAADTAFDAENTQVVGRIMVLGAASIARVNGKMFDLKKLEVTEYGLKDGIGRTQYFGQARNEKWTTGGDYASTPQSFQILCLREG